MPNASEQAIDLMMKMLIFEPHKRITTAQALDHPFFEGFAHNSAAKISDLFQLNFSENKFVSD